MRTSYSNNIIAKLSAKYGLPKGVITKIVESPLLLLRRVMSKECDKVNSIFPTVRIPMFGIFYVPAYKKGRYKPKEIKE